jgi:hypothetical protein
MNWRFHFPALLLVIALAFVLVATSCGQISPTPSTIVVTVEVTPAVIIIEKPVTVVVLAPVWQVSGKWYWKQDPWWGYFYITQKGNLFSGTLDDVYEGTYRDKVINGKIDGNSIEFTRDGRNGIQYWRGTIIERNGVLEIQNGYWRKEGWTNWAPFEAKKVE